MIPIHYRKFLAILLTLLLASCADFINSPEANEYGIHIYSNNPSYWSYNGAPTLLLGGTKEDNIFQIDDLEAHLELLSSVGGNYIRCTLSSRDEGNLKPYSRNEKGLYDLTKPNPLYWERLMKLFDISKKLDIIVQIEIWATYDFYWGDNRWANNPFNPKLNVNYDVAQSKLPDTIAYPAQSKVNPFFESIPELANNEVLLPYQKDFVNRVLEISLNYDHILYCIDNETNAHYSWGQFWSKYLQEQARVQGKEIYITEMWDHWDPTNGAVKGAKVQHPDMGGWYAEYTNPDLHHNSNYAFSLRDTLSYNFIDIANHNAQDGQTHFDTGYWVRQQIINSGKIRPVNNVKIYGADISQEWSGSVKEGEQRFWRNIFAGHASARFHRPSAGIGLNKLAQANIKSMRELTNEVDLFQLEPANELFGDRKSNEAYCLGNGKDQFLVYFPDGGVVQLNIPEGTYSVKGLLIDKTFWLDPKTITYPGVIVAPQDEAWAFVIQKIN